MCAFFVFINESFHKLTFIYVKMTNNCLSFCNSKVFYFYSLYVKIEL